MEECEKFIMSKREARHLKTLNLQRNKFESCAIKNIEGGHSNIRHGEHDKKVNNNTNNEDEKKDDSANHLYTTSNNNAWVRNISSTPLTEMQMKLLNHGPNYAVYVASREQVCTTLKQGEAEELRGHVKAIIKKYNPLVQPN